MKVHQLACPHCALNIRSAAGVDVGRRVPCPKCKKPFVVPAPAAEYEVVEEEDEIEEVEEVEVVDEAPPKKKRPAATAATPPKKRKAAPPPDDDDEDYDDEDDRPRKKRKKEPAKSSWSIGRIIVLSLLVLIMLGLGVALIIKWRIEAEPVVAIKPPGDTSGPGLPPAPGLPLPPPRPGSNTPPPNNDAEMRQLAKQLIGKWEGRAQTNDLVYMEFREDKSFTLRVTPNGAAPTTVTGTWQPYWAGEEILRISRKPNKTLGAHAISPQDACQVMFVNDVLSFRRIDDDSRDSSLNLVRVKE